VLPPEKWGQSWSRVLDTRNGAAPVEGDWQRPAGNRINVDPRSLVVMRRAA